MTQSFIHRMFQKGGLLLLVFLLAGVAAGQTSDTLVIREAMALDLPRTAFPGVIAPTPMDAWFTIGSGKAPREGDVVRLPDGTEAKWQRATPDENGWFSGGRGMVHFAAIVVRRPSPGTMILAGMGHDIVYVNGAPRSGCPYQQKDSRESWEPRFDYSHIPIDLEKGDNLLLFRYTRGRLKVKMYAADKPIMFNAIDVTQPDALIGSALDAWGALPVINATNRALKGYTLLCQVDGKNVDSTVVPNVPAMGVRKVPFRIRMMPRPEKGTVSMRLTLMGGGKMVDTLSLPLRVVGPSEPRKETFISAIDGSVQYYAVLAPIPGFSGRPALFLSLHGASVEALNQAASYAPKPWGYVVAPTNRRPYGFNWEDWGRIDALEVLDLVSKKFGIDEGRVYVTGHSMGGHGTWFMGATHPDRFAAIGPSAGWITFRSYRFARTKDDTASVQQMLSRPSSTSDLFALADNYRQFGVYAIHGEKDDNVPAEQSHMMIERLKPIHKDYVYHEEPGAGHWWDNSPAPGSDCVDWRPLFDFFSRRVRPGMERLRTVEFTTANPGISASDYWLTIDVQERQLTFSNAKLTLDPALNQVQGTTDNIRRLGIDKRVLDPKREATMEFDGQEITVSNENTPGGYVWFEKANGKWTQTGPTEPASKGAHRYGTFKEAFRNRMVLVYGTGGSKEENAWAFEQARYDAERLWYIGNGSMDVLADTEYDPSKEPNRNVILYGNKRTNRLWDALLGDSPVIVDRGRVQVGDKTFKGSDISCIFVRPRKGSGVASVGVIGGTGIEGMSLANTARYLEPGLGLPDLTVFNADVLTEGNAGVLLTGFFGMDWSIASGEFAGSQR